LEALADYVIKEFFPDVEQGDYLGFYKSVVEKTAVMISKWQAVGFCHGVMNTDNFSILGLTIDYGPYQVIFFFSYYLVYGSLQPWLYLQSFRLMICFNLR